MLFVRKSFLCSLRAVIQWSVRTAEPTDPPMRAYVWPRDPRARPGLAPSTGRLRQPSSPRWNARPGPARDLLRMT